MVIWEKMTVEDNTHYSKEWVNRISRVRLGRDLFTW